MTKTTRIVCLCIKYTHHIGIPNRTGIKNITDEEEAFKRQAYIGGVLTWKLDYDYYLKIIPIEYSNINPENTHTKRTGGKDLSNDIYR